LSLDGWFVETKYSCETLLEKSHCHLDVYFRRTDCTIRQDTKFVAIARHIMKGKVMACGLTAIELFALALNTKSARLKSFC
jgi:hypothetical protein